MLLQFIQLDYDQSTAQAFRTISLRRTLFNAFLYLKKEDSPLQRTTWLVPLLEVPMVSVLAHPCHFQGFLIDEPNIRVDSIATTLKPPDHILWV